MLTWRGNGVVPDPVIGLRPALPPVPHQAAGNAGDVAGHRVVAEQQITQSLVGELSARCGAEYSNITVRVCVRQAVRDLRGSVSLGALPEMAARLAYQRLSVASQPDRRRRGPARRSAQAGLTQDRATAAGPRP